MKHDDPPRGRAGTIPGSRHGSYWSREWSGRDSGGHRSEDEQFLRKEAAEKLFHLGRGDSLFDFGCGSAQLLAYYAERFERVVGADFSDRMLAAARERLSAKGLAVELINADENTVWPRLHGEFDVITAGQLVQFLTKSQLDSFVREARVRLRPGGRIVLFDVIHPTEYLLSLVGLLAFGPRPGPIEVARRLSARAARRLIGLPGDVTGYGYRPHEIGKLAARHRMTVEFVGSMYYEYRYHVLLSPILGQSGQ